ncbi:hypothetical protein ANTRET_LOCUS7271 [Anthophora retusa]
MLRFTAWIAALLILIGSVRSQEQILDDTDRDPKFGFGVLESWRKSFCNTFCVSADSGYVVNLACAVKCPELYLPYETTTRSSTVSSSSSSASSSSSTVSSSSSSASSSSSPTSSISPSSTPQTPTPSTVGSTTQSTASVSTSTPTMNPTP